MISFSLLLNPSTVPEEMIPFRLRCSRPHETACVTDPNAGRQIDDPRTVVAKWMDLVLADNVRESWELTTKSKGLNAQHDLPRLRNKDEVQIERSLGNETVAVVVTNTVTHVSSGVDRAFAFWLVQRDGSWLIKMSY